MSDQTPARNIPEDGGGQATPTKPRKDPAGKLPTPQPLPPWKVLLHNDDVNEVDAVIKTVMQLTPLNEQRARQCVSEADKTGVSLLLVTHRERAELYVEQFDTRRLIVTAEAEK